MPVFTRAAAVSLSLFLIFGAVVSGPAEAQQAAPCSGTLCDLYYGGANNAAPAPSATTPQPTAAGLPAGATPMTVPSSNFFTGLFSRNTSQQAATDGSTGAQQAGQAQSSYIPGVHMGGGGLLGDHSQPQCEGTICDLLGRSTPTREQVPAANEQVAVGTTPPQAGSVAYTPTKHYDPIQEKPRCHNADDPWHCYR